MSVLALESPVSNYLVPLPPFEPPYDDQLLDCPVDDITPMLPLGFPRLQLVRDHAPSRPADSDDAFGPQRTPTQQLLAAHRFAWQFVQAAVEMADGRRSAGQLSRFMTTSITTALERKGAMRARMAAARSAAVPAVVQSVRVCEVGDGIAEVSAVVRRGQRSVAVAARFEGTDGRWLCTALQM